MNKHNVIVTEQNGEFIAEWADRAPDDEDRYAPDAIILKARGKTEKEMWADMALAYDTWFKKTRA